MTIRCAIYTRKSTEEGLEQEFNSLDAQRDACESYIQSQRGLGWKVIRKHYDDGGVSGGTLQRQALTTLLADIDAGQVDLVVVYKVDRLTRSLMDFSKIIEAFDARDVSFVSVTQQFNTANSMGRLTLNMLLSFAQFEREVTAERIRDKIAASKRKGLWTGGVPPLGYDNRDRKLVENREEAKIVRELFTLYLEHGSVRVLKEKADALGITTKRRLVRGRETGGRPFSRGNLYGLLHNPVYIGDVVHKGERFPGQHEAIIDRETWDRVQQGLEDGTPVRESSRNVDRRCLLTGIVFDETGDRLCPTYAKKGDRIHAYYVSKRLVRLEARSDGGWRLPARELENAVIRAVADVLNSEADWIKLLGAVTMSPGAYEIARAQAARTHAALTAGKPAQVRGALRELVQRVAVRPGEISVTFMGNALHATQAGEAGTPGHELRLPFRMQRRGVEARIVLGGVAETRSAPDATLIAALKRSFEWSRLLTTEGGWSIQKLAVRDQVDASDVTRFLPLAFLSPRIVETILAGRQPFDFTLERFKKGGRMPMAWRDQEVQFGFAELDWT
jgi:DNA invertase Pin-like site-specific DNA recombinase